MLSNHLIVRAASLDDAAAINSIYNPFIRDSAVTFETDEYSVINRRRWIEQHAASQREPVFVGVTPNGAIGGFASAAPFDPRGAYKTSVKTSVFVDPNHHGGGVATQLYTALFDALASVDVHRAYALIVSPNAGSVALHQRFGFQKVAILNEVGRKFGRYYDVMWFEKRF